MAARWASRGLAVALAVPWLAGCADNVGLPADPGTAIRFPIALAAAPSGRYVYVAGANFDRKYRGGTLRVIDTVAAKLVGKGLEIPGFTGGVALQLQQLPAMADAPTATDAAPRRLILTSRDDDGLTSVDVDAASLGCGGHDSLGRCAAAYRYGDAESSSPIGADPMGIDIAPWPAQPGAWQVTVAASASGKVSVLRLDSGGTFSAIGSASFGSGLSHVRSVPASGRVYISDMRAPQLHVLRIEPGSASASGWQVVAEPSVVLPSATTGEFGRGMAVSRDGARLYLVDRSPRALLEVDISADSSGVPRNQVVGVLPVGPKPAEVVLAPTGPGGRELAYVSCFGDDSIWVVDPWLRQVVDVIRLPHGPYGLTVAQVPGDPQQGAGWTLYAGLFSRHAIAVVPVDPAAADRHRLRGLLEGTP